MQRSETPPYGQRRRLLLLAVGLLVSSSLVSFCHAASCPSRLPPPSLQLQGLRRQVLEGGNATLALAAERTHRRDPLNNFHYYTGGWNITDVHYLSSTAFSAVPLVAVAVVWFVGLGLFVICSLLCCCCYFCRRTSDNYSRVCFCLSLSLLIFFTIAAVIGCGMLYTGQREFFSSVEDTFKYILGTGVEILRKATNLWDKLKTAKDIKINGDFLFAADVRNSIQHFDDMIHNSNITLPDRVSNTTIHYLNTYLNPVKISLNVLAGVMLGVAVLGLLFSLCGVRVVVYVFVILGWILVTATILLSAVFLIFHNVVADTCMAMDQWVDNPKADSALKQILPCMDPHTVAETLKITKTVTQTGVETVNDYFTFVNSPGPVNLSGPLVPLLCNPLDAALNPRPCAPGEIKLSDAKQTYKAYECQVDEKGNCKTAGRLTPMYYNQMMGVVNVGMMLDEYAPFLGKLADCTIVRDTFLTIGSDHCPGLSLTSRWIYAGLASVSGAVMFALILWLIFLRQRGHRARAKNYTVEMTRI